MAWSDVHVESVGFSGNVVTVRATNPGASAETFRIRLTVALAGGGSEVLTSTNLTLDPNASRTFDLQASGSITEITDDPDPIEPS